MTLPAHVGRGRRSGVVLVSLLLGTFVTGSAELLTVGRLPLISSGLGVAVAAAGALFSAYALGLAIGGPLLTAATIRLDRRPVLVGSMALFAMLVVAPAALPTSHGSLPHDWGRERRELGTRTYSAWVPSIRCPRTHPPASRH